MNIFTKQHIFRFLFFSMLQKLNVSNYIEFNYHEMHAMGHFFILLVLIHFI